MKIIFKQGWDVCVLHAARKLFLFQFAKFATKGKSFGVLYGTKNVPWYEMLFDFVFFIALSMMNVCSRRGDRKHGRFYTFVKFLYSFQRLFACMPICWSSQESVSERQTST